MQRRDRQACQWMENPWTLNDTSRYHCRRHQDHSPHVVMLLVSCTSLTSIICCILPVLKHHQVIQMCCRRHHQKSWAWGGLKRIPNPFFFVIQFRVAIFMKIVIQSQTGVCYGYARINIYIHDVLLVRLNVHVEYYVKNNLYPPYM